MKKLTLVFGILIVSYLVIAQDNTEEVCESKGKESKPIGIAVITGKAMISIPGEKAPLPATSETIMFQRVGCPQCVVATTPGTDGTYKIMASDGKYKVIVENPSPVYDMLSPDQERYISTETLDAKQHSQHTFNFDIKIQSR